MDLQIQRKAAPKRKRVDDGDNDDVTAAAVAASGDVAAVGNISNASCYKDGVDNDNTNNSVMYDKLKRIESGFEDTDYSKWKKETLMTLNNRGGRRDAAGPPPPIDERRATLNAIVATSTTNATTDTDTASMNALDSELNKVANDFDVMNNNDEMTEVNDDGFLGCCSASRDSWCYEAMFAIVGGFGVKPASPSTSTATSGQPSSEPDKRKKRIEEGNGDDSKPASVDSRPSYSDLLDLVSKTIPERLKRAFPTEITSSACFCDDDDHITMKKRALITRYALELKKDLRVLSKFGFEFPSMIETMINRTKQELTSAINSLSPLLSLDGNLLSIIIEFLDEEGLYNCELASVTLNDFINHSSSGQDTNNRSGFFWKQLYERRRALPPPLRNIEPTCPTEDQFMNFHVHRYHRHCFYGLNQTPRSEVDLTLTRVYDLAPIGCHLGIHSSHADDMTRMGRHFGFLASRALKMEQLGPKYALLGDRYLSSNLDVLKKKNKSSKKSKKGESFDVFSYVDFSSAIYGRPMDFEPSTIGRTLQELKSQNPEGFEGFMTISKRKNSSPLSSERRILWQGFCKCNFIHFDDDVDDTDENLHLDIALDGIIPHLATDWPDVLRTINLPEVRSAMYWYSLGYDEMQNRPLVSERTRRWLVNQFARMMRDVFITLLDPYGRLLLYTSGTVPDAPIDGNDAQLPDMLSPCGMTFGPFGCWQVTSSAHFFEKDIAWSVNAFPTCN